jgi:hypothetical protein
MTLSADELLAGSALTFEIAVPAHVLRPGEDGGNGERANGRAHTMRLRPLTVRDLQLISRAAKENGELVATLMVQRALIEPAMTVPQVAGMHVGLLEFLLQQVNRISGIATSADYLATLVDAPLAKAAFVLAREFGWTPQEVNELTLGQIALHLQMLHVPERAQP